jgi:opacity protein-like surface antigen
MKKLLTFATMAFAVAGIDDANAHSKASARWHNYQQHSKDHSLNDDGIITHNTRLYTGVRLGYSLMQDIEIDRRYNVDGDLEFDSGIDYGVFFGSYLADQLRLELEFASRSHDIDGFDSNDSVNRTASGEIETFTTIVNAYYDFDKITNRWTPYVGAGLGLVNTDNSTLVKVGDNIVTRGEDDSGIAFQLMSGIMYDITDKVSLLGEYKYIDINYDDVNGGNYHEFNFGAMYKF